ncbi:helix-turn-helix domain-containing protein [Leptothoe sp. ISB3NOV94-8A]
MNIAQEPKPYFERQGLILDSGLPPNERFVLLVINEYSSADGTGAFPKQKTIADKTGYSRKTVNQCIKRLEAKKLVSQTRNYRDDGGWRNSNYVVHWDEVKTCGETAKANKINAVTERNRGCNDFIQGGVTERYSRSTHNDLPNSSHSYGTVFSSKSTHSHEEELFSNSGKEKPEDNCTSTQADTSPNGRISNSQSQKSSAESLRKTNIPKPIKRRLFDGTFGLSCDHNGWLKLPETLETDPQYRDVIGLMKAQTLVWLKVWFVENYADDLDLYVERDFDDDIYSISGKDFEEVSYDEFLDKDGPISIQLMRDVVDDRVGGFQEEFNQKLNKLFWAAWHRFVKQAA